MTNRDLIVIGASAGGVEAYQQLIPLLPSDLPAAVLLVLHTGHDTPRTLAGILGAHSLLPVEDAEDGTRLEPGHVYVGVPNYHLRVEDSRMRLTLGPKENRHRPSVDTLFRSAAQAKGAAVIGVVLTGLLDDGSAGLAVIKAHGGVAVVQDPDDAIFDSMPRSAMEAAGPDYVVPLEKMASLLVRLTKGEAPAPAPHLAARSRKSKGVATMPRRTVPPDHQPTPTENKPGAPSVYTCPECSGTLWQVSNGEVERYECRVGHAYSLASLVEAHSEAVEEALWVALRTLEESASLSRRMAERAREKRHNGLATRWEDLARGKEENAQLLRGILTRAAEQPAVNQ